LWNISYNNEKIIKPIPLTFVGHCITAIWSCVELQHPRIFLYLQPAYSTYGIVTFTSACCCIRILMYTTFENSRIIYKSCPSEYDYHRGICSMKLDDYHSMPAWLFYCHIYQNIRNSTIINFKFMEKHPVAAWRAPLSNIIVFTCIIYTLF
jgi:hypothetical protein